MKKAISVSTLSPDPNTHVGVCIVNKEEKIVSEGYNDMPDECEDKFPWDRENKPWLETKYPYVCHAAMNAIVKNESGSLKGSTLYTTILPCNDCAKMIIQAGITRVVYGWNKYAKFRELEATERLFEAANVSCEEFKSKTEQYFNKMKNMEGDEVVPMDVDYHGSRTDA